MLHIILDPCPEKGTTKKPDLFENLDIIIGLPRGAL